VIKGQDEGQRVARNLISLNCLYGHVPNFFIFRILAVLASLSALSGSTTLRGIPGQPPRLPEIGCLRAGER
jgi:hypothetical protein